MRRRTLALALAAALLLTAGVASARHSVVAHPWTLVVEDPEAMCVAQEGVMCFAGPFGVGGAVSVDRHLTLQRGLGCEAGTSPSAACAALVAGVALAGPWPGAPACAALDEVAAVEPAATALRPAAWGLCDSFWLRADAGDAAGCVLDGARWDCTTFVCTADLPPSFCGNGFLAWGFARR